MTTTMADPKWIMFFSLMEVLQMVTLTYALRGVDLPGPITFANGLIFFLCDSFRIFCGGVLPLFCPCFVILSFECYFIY